LTDVSHGMVCHVLYPVLCVIDGLSEWALPDQLVFSTVSALLRICGAHQEYADKVVKFIITFIADIVENLKDSTCKVSIWPSMRIT
jgi:hypothetical protein